MKLYINTLGDFDLIIGGNSLLKESNRSYRLYKLFQYFVTFKNKKLLPETIIDNLWQDNESQDPKNMLRAQIFRLRQMIKKILPEGTDESQYLHITFNNGYYSLEIGEMTILDIDEFETLIAKGDSAGSEDINLAIKAYKEALRLYKGAYLGENIYEVWLVPVRNYYSRLYLKTLFKLIEILNEKEEYDEVINLCEIAITIEPYEEAVHIYLIEAMLKLGQIKNAMSHYEYITSLLEKEFGTRPSSAMVNIHRKIQNYFIEKDEINIANIKDKLENEDTEGPLLCDSDYFKFLFNVQRRKREKEDSDFIGIITLNSKRNCSKEELTCWSKVMMQVVEKTFRKGDAYTFWNDTQILIILYDVKENGLEAIKGRVNKSLNSIIKDSKYNISIKFMPITTDTHIAKYPS